MTVADVKKQIKDKQPSSFYIFTGEELEVMNIYIKKIAEVANANINRADTLSSVFSKVQNKSFLVQRTCFVIRDDKEFLSAEDIWNRVDDTELPFKDGNLLQGNNIIIMLYTNIDKRSKLYKHFENTLVTFEKLSESNLLHEIQKRVQLNEKNAKMLMYVCENDLGRILQEIDKIKRYAEHELDAPFTQDVVHWQPNDVFEQLLKDGTIYQPPTDSIWDFVEAVLHHRIKPSFGLMQEALEFGNPVLTLLSVLYKDVKQLLQVQACQSSDVAGSTGLSGWDIKRASSRKGVYTNRELIDAMKIIRQTEIDIKSGNIEEAMALDYVLVNIL